jgi:hypothetical protein
MTALTTLNWNGLRMPAPDQRIGMPFRRGLIGAPYPRDQMFSFWSRGTLWVLNWSIYYPCVEVKPPITRQDRLSVTVFHLTQRWVNRPCFSTRGSLAYLDPAET